MAKFNKLKQWLVMANSWAHARVTSHHAPYLAFGIFGTLFIHSLPFFLRVNADSFIFIVICYLQAIGSALNLMLIFNELWSYRFKKFLPIFWSICLLICLPFTSTVVVLLSGWHPSSLNYFTISLCLLGTLVDWVGFMTLSILGISLGSLLNALFFGFPMTNTHIFSERLVFGAIFILITGIIFLRMKEKYFIEKAKALRAISGTLAHELRTPLASIQLVARALQDQLPAVLDSHNHALTKLHPSTLALLRDVPNQLARSSGDALNIVEILLGRIYESKKTQIGDLIYIDTCMEHAINGYCFREDELSLIKWRRFPNFSFYGHQKTLVQILFNLLSNSLYFINAEKKGFIEIWYELGERENELHFKDTAIGIAHEDLPYIFDFGFSRRSGGEGVGLYFCKNAMRAINGDIQCESNCGEFTKMILKFPRE